MEYVVASEAHTRFGSKRTYPANSAIFFRIDPFEVRPAKINPKQLLLIMRCGFEIGAIFISAITFEAG